MLWITHSYTKPIPNLYKIIGLGCRCGAHASLRLCAAPGKPVVQTHTWMYWGHMSPQCSQVCIHTNAIQKPEHFENHEFLVFWVSQLCKSKIEHCENDGPANSFDWFYQKNKKNENVKAKNSSQIAGFRARQKITIFWNLVDKIRNAKLGFLMFLCRENDAPASTFEKAIMQKSIFLKNHQKNHQFLSKTQKCKFCENRGFRIDFHINSVCWECHRGQWFSNIHIFHQKVSKKRYAKKA